MILTKSQIDLEREDYANIRRSLDNVYKMAEFDANSLKSWVSAVYRKRKIETGLSENPCSG